MAILSSLPEELQLGIISYVPNQSLFALARTSTSFNRLVTPIVYRFLYFREAKDPRGNYLQQIDYCLSDWEERIGGASAIHRLSPFLRTIAEFPLLCSYIHAADFQWHSDCYFDNTYSRSHDVTNSETYRIISKILNLLPRDLKLLRLSLLNHEFLFPPATPVTSLQLCYPGGLGVEVWDGEFEIPIDKVYSVFQIPTLRHLAYIDPRHWDHFTPSITLGIRAATSNVTFLSFIGGAPVGVNFPEMMTWPIALKTFHMTISPDEVHIGDRNGTSAARLCEGLLPQRTTLEEIFIGGTWTTLEKDSTTFGYLQSFSALKRLGIAEDFLMAKEIQEREVGPAMWEVLPPALQELQLEVSPHFDWGAQRDPRMKPRRKYWYNSKEKPYLSLHGDWLSKCLREVGQHQEEKLPNLKTVAIWQAVYSGKRERSVSPTVENPPEPLHLFETFNRAGIELYCDLDRYPPLFGY